MSILETFYVLFKTNADEAAKNVADVGKAADGAESKLAKMDSAASKIGSSFVNFARSLVAPLMGLAAFGSATDIAIARAGAVLRLDQAASKLNSSVSQVDAFTRAVAGAGGTTDQAVDSLAKLAEKVNEAFSDAKSGARKDFNEWGLSFKGVKGQALGAVDAMLALAGNLEKVSRAEALARIKKLGIEDASTIDMLLKGRRAVKEYMDAEKEQGVVTEEQVRLAREYQRELGKTGNLLTSFSNKIMELALPAVSAMVRGIRAAVSWMGNNQKLVEGFFIGVAAAVSLYFLPAMASAAAATIAATWPFLAIGAVIAAVGAAFALAYEDVQAFLNGQPSLLGELVAKYQWVATAVEWIGKAWQALKAGVAAASDALVTAFNAVVEAVTPIVSAVAEGAGAIVTALIEIYTPVWNALSKLFSALTDLISKWFSFWTALWGRALSPVVEISQQLMVLFDPVVTHFEKTIQGIPKAFRIIAGAVRAIWEALIGWITDKIDGFTKTIEKLTSWIPGADSVASSGGESVSSGPREAMIRGRSVMTQVGQFPGAAAAATKSTAVQNRTDVSIGQVTVNTQATDAEGVAKAVRGALQKELRNTSAQLDDGVDR